MSKLTQHSLQILYKFGAQFGVLKRSTIVICGVDVDGCLRTSRRERFGVTPINAIDQSSQGPLVLGGDSKFVGDPVRSQPVDSLDRVGRQSLEDHLSQRRIDFTALLL